MRKLVLLMAVALAAMAVGAATVLASHGADDNEHACAAPMAGAARLSGGSGNDTVRGGSGNDRINVRDGRRDHVNCGSGKDTVKADRKDVVSHNCEHVHRG